MTVFDAKVPAKLKKSQMWFGSIIGRPIDEDSRMNPIAPSGQTLEIEACEHIRPSPTLRPAQRIEIYNQQYWWRLLKIMHDIFPLVTRLFGYHDFNRLLAIPYLVEYPPSHWSLNELGKFLSCWIEERYQENDRGLTSDASKVDWAFHKGFFEPQKTPILTSTLPQGSDVASVLDEKFFLQPHASLFCLPYDLFSFRLEFLKQEPEHWIDNDFPPLKKEKQYSFVVFRNVDNNLQWIEISYGQYKLLEFIQSGKTIDEACLWLEQQDPNIYEEAKDHLHHWFQSWIVHRLLTLESP
jgi:Putative DNA-binding domain